MRIECSGQLRFTQHDLIALCLAIFIPIIAIVLTLISVLPALGAPPLPSFAEPVKGFEPRGTKLSDKIVTYDNLDDDPSGITRTYPIGQRITQGQENKSNIGHSRQKRRSLNNSLLPPFFSRYVYSRVVFVYEATDATEDLFTANKLKTLCAMDTDIVHSNQLFQTHCNRFDKPPCYSSWSLGNYVALLNNRKTCQNVTEEDVSKVRNLLQNCSSYFVQETLGRDCRYPEENNTVSPNCRSVPPDCIQHSAVYNIFQYLVDSKFMATPQDNTLKYTLSIPPPLSMTDEVFEDWYNKLKDTNHIRNGVKLAAFKFDNFKFNKFSEKLLVEVIFPALAMIVVFAIMWMFLGSFILTFCALFCVVYAVGLAYFFYNMVFKMEFFPFLNVLTLVFLVGIGADDAFVYYDIWKQTMASYPKANIWQLTLKTLQYSALSMLVTSLTTASAFFAGVSSTITAIKCFGIFAGTSILTNYLLMITYFPAVVALHEKWIRKYNDVGDFQTENVTPSEKVSSPETQDMSKSRCAEAIGSTQTQVQQNFCILQIIDFPCSLAVSVQNVIRKFTRKIFERCLPFLVTKYYWLWIMLFLCLTAGFLCVNFVKPGLNLPESKEFQLFSASHAIERYDLKYRSSFRFESYKMIIQLIWGIKPADNGNHFNPDKKGTLEFDESFGDLFTKKGQEFLQSMCLSAQNQSFFAAFRGSRGCPIESFIQQCSSAFANVSFPFPSEVVEKCLQQVASHDAVTGLLFDPVTADIKGFIMEIITNQQYTNAFSAMDTFYKKVNNWVETEMTKAPPGLKNGWAGSWGFSFYALQLGLSKGTYSSLGISVAVSFVVMLLTTLNIFVSIYAIITIIGIIAITIGSLVLAGWQLNILESIVMSVAVGLSIDFTMHYGVAYRLAPDKAHRENRVQYSLVHIGSAVTMAALTTFLTGLMMMPATVLAYYQLGQFLMLVMVFSWLYSTFAFLSICAVIGPKDNFGQLSITRLFRRCNFWRVDPEPSQKPSQEKEITVLSIADAGGEANSDRKSDLLTTNL